MSATAVACMFFVIQNMIKKKAARRRGFKGKVEGAALTNNRQSSTRHEKSLCKPMEIATPQGLQAHSRKETKHWSRDEF